ncbi:transposase family protein [Nonomuraea basaltis]|uniref:transposase family protein n=1 Tax=Nonomuraea basaltis TaxID=2495887 RepID=UPI001486E317|nr:transposase family protein [Nonomuraea basaltis]
MLARHLEPVSVANLPSDLPDLPALAEVLNAVPDPRSRRGRRYRIGPLLALSLLAVIGGATSMAKITRFIAGYDPELRARAGLPGTPQLAATTSDRQLIVIDDVQRRRSRSLGETHGWFAERHTLVRR